MHSFRRVLPAIMIAAVLLALWELYCAHAADVSPLILPSPSDILRALWRNRADIGTHATSTLTVAALGFSASVAFAFAVSVALHFVPPLERGLMPLFVV